MDKPVIHIYEWQTPQDSDGWSDDYPWALSFGPFLEPVALFTDKSFAEAAASGLLESVLEESQ